MQCSAVKKSQSGNIPRIWGEAPTVPIEMKICTVCNLADVSTCAKFQDEIIFTILHGVKFRIFLLIFAWALQQQRYCAACDKVKLVTRQTPVLFTEFKVYKAFRTEHRTTRGVGG